MPQDDFDVFSQDRDYELEAILSSETTVLIGEVRDRNDREILSVMVLSPRGRGFKVYHAL